MTGRFPAREQMHGHLSDHEINQARGMPNWLDPGAATYTRLLQQAGYRVGHFGKWHLGNGPGAPEPSAYGIDDSFVNAGEGPQLEFARERWGPGLRIRSTGAPSRHRRKHATPDLSSCMLDSDDGREV